MTPQGIARVSVGLDVAASHVARRAVKIQQLRESAVRQTQRQHSWSAAGKSGELPSVEQHIAPPSPPPEPPTPGCFEARSCSCLLSPPAPRVVCGTCLERQGVVQAICKALGCGSAAGKASLATTQASLARESRDPRASPLSQHARTALATIRELDPDQRRATVKKLLSAGCRVNAQCAPHRPCHGACVLLQSIYLSSCRVSSTVKAVQGMKRVVMIHLLLQRVQDRRWGDTAHVGRQLSFSDRCVILATIRR